MADDVFYAVSSELVGNRNTLLRIGNVVTERDRDLFAIDTAGIIDFLDCSFSTLLNLSTINSIWTGQRCADAQQYICPSRATESHHCCKSNA
ncbi:hypothetical protein D9M69_632940 [compost metagenome]